MCSCACSGGKGRGGLLKWKCLCISWEPWKPPSAPKDLLSAPNCHRFPAGLSGGYNRIGLHDLRKSIYNPVVLQCHAGHGTNFRVFGQMACLQSPKLTGNQCPVHCSSEPGPPSARFESRRPRLGALWACKSWATTAPEIKEAARSTPMSAGTRGNPDAQSAGIQHSTAGARATRSPVSL